MIFDMKKIIISGMMVMAMALLFALMKPEDADVRAERILLEYMNCTIENADGVFIGLIPNHDEDTDFVGYHSITDKIIADADFLEIRSLIRETINAKIEFHMMCHDPGYGVAFTRNGYIIFKTTVCFKCSNLGINAMGSKFYPTLKNPVQLEVVIKRMEKTIKGRLDS